jgi:transcriptional regulator of acetoin/glycerol metabolism
MKIDKAVLQKMKKYFWPGNIRELQHAVERAVILSEDRVITSPELLISGSAAKPKQDSPPRTLEEMEKIFILQSLDDNGGNVSQTALALGMTRTALYRRMKKHGI